MMMTSNTTQGTSTTTSTGAPVTSYSDGSFADNKPSVHEQVTSSTDRIMIFRTAGVNHTFTVPAGGLVCDILMIGGGGGQENYKGGGGAGACIVAINQTLPAGSCVVYVGVGGISSNGGDSYILVAGADRYRAKGGGAHPNDGGCGAGGICAAYAITSTSFGTTPVSTNVLNGSTAGPGVGSAHAVLGNRGGDQFQINGANNDGSRWGSAGGGGIGSRGADHPLSQLAGGNGGNGVYQVLINGTIYNFKNYFANSGAFGVQSGDNYYIGGGGGGYGEYPYGTGGLGGGGGDTISAAQNTGSGGGGYNGSGASGIIIIRYKNSVIPFPTTTTPTTYTHTSNLTTTLTTTLGTPSIELVRGTQGDSNTDYKIGNYNGDFIVKSSTSNIDTDRFNITTAGNIGIGITNPAVKLQVVGGDFACSGDISAYYSDERLKTRLSNIKDPLEIIGKLNGFYYIPNDLARFYGITNMAQEIGLSAQEVNKVLPELVKIAPFDLSRDEDNNKISKSGENYLTLSYDRLAPVFVEAIKELRCSNDDLNEKYNRLLERFVNDEKL